MPKFVVCGACQNILPITRSNKHKCVLMEWCSRCCWHRDAAIHKNRECKFSPHKFQHISYYVATDHKTVFHIDWHKQVVIIEQEGKRIVSYKGKTTKARNKPMFLEREEY